MSFSTYNGVYASGTYYMNQVSTIWGYVPENVPENDIRFPDSPEFLGGARQNISTNNLDPAGQDTDKDVSQDTTSSKTTSTDMMPGSGLQASFSRHYVDNARKYTPMGFNMLLAMSFYSVYGDRCLLARFCNNPVLESIVVHAIENMRGLIKKTMRDSNGESLIEVAIRRSSLLKMFFSQQNKKGSLMLSTMFMRDSSALLSSNIRKIWGSLKLDIDKASIRGTRSSTSFLKNIGYRNSRSNRFEFVMVFPLMNSS